MAGNSRLATAIHIAGILSFTSDAPITSEIIAQSVGTNPVVVRRIIGLLACHKIVKVKMGTGGGASLARPPAEITLAEIYAALDEGSVFDVPLFDESHKCGIGKTVRPILTDVLRFCEEGMTERLAKITLADVIEQVKVKILKDCQNKIDGRRKKEEKD